MSEVVQRKASAVSVSSKSPLNSAVLLRPVVAEVTELCRTLTSNAPVASVAAP